jgi:4-amino-4-deoxy-L-arabinose transferase-like glycosyltransferase
VSAFRDTKTSALLALVFLLSFFTRFLALDYFDVRDRYQYDSTGYLDIDGEHGDEREYEGRAWNLIEGKDFWALPNGDGSAPPGYPFLVAMLYSATGRDFMVPLVANAVFGGVLSLAVYFLARQSLSHSQALLGAAGVAIDPFLVFWSTRITTESLGVLLAVLCLIAMTQARERQSLRLSLFCGLLCGVAMLVRGNLIVLPLAFAAWNLLTPSLGRWRQTLTVLVCTFLVVFPVTMFGVKSRPSQTESQWERAGRWLTTDRYREVALDKAARQKGGSLTREEKRNVEHDAAVFVQMNPWWDVLARTWIHNFSVFWQLTPSIGSRTVAAVYSGTTVCLILFGAVGAASLLRAQATRQQTILWLLVIAGFSVIHTVLISQPRYRLILEPLLWILAISGGAALLQLISARAFRTAALRPH